MPDSLKKERIDLSHFGINEYGWPKKSCLKYIQYLRNNRIPILGGDIYIINDKEIIPTYDNWHIEKKHSESINSFASRSAEVTETYIMSYPEDNNVIFVIVI